jgi:tetratricopeptide (TPR) repeat protein/predicted transcriptional regulator
MDDGTLDSRTLSVLTKRTGILERLADAPAHKRDLVDELDQSRSTINRAIDELSSVALVRRDDEGYTATLAGRLALDRLAAFRGELDDVVAAEDVLAPLPFDAPVETATVAGGTAMRATDPAPYRALEGFHEDLADAGTYRALLPALDDPRHVRLLYEHVVTDDDPAELVVSPAVYDTLRTEFPRRMTAMAETGDFELLVGDVPPFALGIVGDGDGTDATAHVVVFGEHGGVHGTLANGTDGAVRWAEDCYAAAKEGASHRTDALFADADGGAAVDDGSRAVIGNQLPVALEREGFVQLNVPYFREQSVSDPTTAWRAGLTLPEVHTGYAVERTLDVDGPRDGAGMTGALVADLEAGADRVVVGPPGSGKSTVCKRVACEWYTTDRGPVLYRESGHGRPFESVEELAVALDAVDGHALVVVEDAPRREADAVFDAVDRFADREDVSFLLDSREREWRDPPGDPGDPPTLGVVSMPPLGDEDAERIVEHFERTAGETVSAPADRLREEVGEAARSTDGESAPGEVLLLLHRLATLADPLVSERTSMEAAVSDAFEDLADDDLALDVCVLANALNAAGIGVAPGALYAVADRDDFEAVDDAIGRLEGRILFPDGSGGYRTVHESWSVAFLEHLVDVEGRALAAERFGDCVSAFLSLADDPARRDRIARHSDGEVSLSGVVDDAGAWADDAVEALFGLARDRPKLAPLFGDDRDSVALPAACSDSLRDEVVVWLGRGFLDAGELDRARQSFERLPADGTELDFERRLGLSQVAGDGGDLDGAIDHAEACLSLAEELDDPELRARARRRLGWAHADGERFDEAEPHLRRALERFETLGETRLKARTLDHLGVVERRRTEYDAAIEYHRRGLELCEELGDRRGVARSHNNLGSIEMHRGDHHSARDHYEHALEYHRHVGNRRAVARVLSNLGLVARHLDEYEDAEAFHSRALDVADEVGDPKSKARNLGNLGLLAKKRDEYERAIDHYERTLEIFREVDLAHGEAKAYTNLAEVAVQQGDSTAAREYVAEGSDVFEELGDKQGLAISANVLGAAAREEGELDEAVEEFRRSVELFGSIGVAQGRAVARRNLGEVLSMQGDVEAAREQWRTAVETFEEVGAPDDELETLKFLVGTSREEGDDDTARRWCEQARETLAGAPDPVARRHREWIEESAAALEAD